TLARFRVTPKIPAAQVVRRLYVGARPRRLHHHHWFERWRCPTPPARQRNPQSPARSSRHRRRSQLDAQWKIYRAPERSRAADRGFYGSRPIRHHRIDRKSTRLNSSHVSISYAVFCLKKKKKKHIIT